MSCCECCKGTIEYDLDYLTDKSLLLPNSRSLSKANRTFTPPEISDRGNKLITYGTVDYDKKLDLNKLVNKGARRLDVRSISFGDKHSLILVDVYKTDENVIENSILYGVGSNEEGQLGIDYIPYKENVYKDLTEISYKDRTSPNYAFWGKLDYDVLDIDVGDNFSLVTIQYKQDKSIALLRFQLSKEDKFEIQSGNCTKANFRTIKNEKFNNANNGGIKQVAIFGDRIIVLTNANYLYMKGTLYDMTNENDFALIKKFNTNILYMTIGINNSLLLAENNMIYALGHNEYCEFGIKEDKNMKQTLYNQATKLSTMGRKKEREVFENDYFLKHNLKIIKIESGARHSMVLCENGKVYCFGDNTDGQCCGLEKLVETPTLVEFDSADEFIVDICCGFNHSIAKSSSGKIFVWGDSAYDKLGFKEKRIDQYNPVEISDLKIRNVVRIFAGPMQTAFFVSGAINLEN